MHVRKPRALSMFLAVVLAGGTLAGLGPANAAASPQEPSFPKMTVKRPTYCPEFVDFQDFLDEPGPLDFDKVWRKGKRKQKKCGDIKVNSATKATFGDHLDKGAYDLVKDCDLGKADYCRFENDTRVPQGWEIIMESSEQPNCSALTQTLTVSSSVSITATDSVSETYGTSNSWDISATLSGKGSDSGSFASTLKLGFEESTSTTWTYSTSLTELMGVSQTVNTPAGYKGKIVAKMPMQMAKGDLTVRYLQMEQHDFKVKVYAVEYVLEDYAAKGPGALNNKHTRLIPKTVPMTADDYRDSCDMPNVAGRDYESRKADAAIVSLLTKKTGQIMLPQYNITDDDDGTSDTVPTKWGLWWQIRNKAPDQKLSMFRVKWGNDRCDRADIHGIQYRRDGKTFTFPIATLADGASIVKAAKPVIAHDIVFRCLDEMDPRGPSKNDRPVTLRSFEVYPELP
ncbi:hypothetical protein [Streptomyces sp. NPDC058572]|uniref:hypothetical protein n=1 Tax=Streptomyces sp. NPDC058572 TaxID=3346546 RepID=UPI003662CF39